MAEKFRELGSSGAFVISGDSPANHFVRQRPRFAEELEERLGQSIQGESVRAAHLLKKPIAPLQKLTEC